jgi:hypothetical protein
MAQSLEQRVQELADRDEIKELTARYCWHVAQGEGELIVDLFTADGVLDASRAELPLVKGRDELKNFYVRSVREPAMAIPFIHNHIIQIKGDTASGTCAIEARFSRSGESITAAGYYEDTYRREGGKWKFAERKLFFHHMVPLKQGWAEAAEASKKK